MDSERFDQLVQEILKQKQLMDQLEEENRELRKLLTDLRAGRAISVAIFRNLFPSKLWKYIFLPFWIILSPVLLLTVLISHISLFLNLGSEEDPLGYTILVVK